ncbi:D-alanyl-D-alanine carboxypeptidase family protein [Chiayiivirga flava]|uniref:serine-type D-Ala-D-Ala carboxypeptidase n=1 Tax=Chiayiivirga flava TaxID=659595 RepID=A0A7W8DA83_9GAMM|nr:D-alanyl-D-alanine carboxypeptidase family protein [Chiayiivirga flava]MBB5209612.1 D-alanyl-D-alanine carboxypeptidase (penicillin-binding protein 5/6) [Chiayiivirga flava]
MKFLGVSLALLFAGAATAQVPTPQPVPKPAAPVPQAAPTPPPPAITGTAWLLMDDATGQVLAGSNEEQRVEPASITKVMTSYVVSAELKNGKIKLDDEVLISENAWRGGGGGTDGSTSFLPVNSKVKLEDLLHGMIVQSGNDASIALAEHVAGSEDAFASLMNAYAERIGMRDTHFVNSHGLSAPDHYTTAHDIARMSQALIRDFPEEYAQYALKEFTFNGIRQYNRNSLLWKDASVDGIKTGHHSGAGFCLAASAKRGDQRLISVVMGSTGEKQRADDSLALLNWGFRFFESHKLYDAGAEVTAPVLWKGETDTVPLGLAAPLLVTVERGKYEQVKATMDLPRQLVAPIARGQEVGTLRLTLGDRTLVERPLVALADAPEGGFFTRVSDGFWMWWESE